MAGIRAAAKFCQLPQKRCGWGVSESRRGTFIGVLVTIRRSSSCGVSILAVPCISSICSHTREACGQGPNNLLSCQGHTLCPSVRNCLEVRTSTCASSQPSSRLLEAQEFDGTAHRNRTHPTSGTHSATLRAWCCKHPTSFAPPQKAEAYNSR